MTGGYQNRAPVREAIYFHIVGLDHTPAAARFHTEH